MRRLTARLDGLEQRLAPTPPRRWVRVLRREGQTEKQAVAAWEAENGALGERSVIIRAIISPQSLSRSGSALCPL